VIQLGTDTQSNSADLDGIPMFIIGKDALILNKRAVGRKQDLADLEILEN
jgi:hypothetical protein